MDTFTIVATVPTNQYGEYSFSVFVGGNFAIEVVLTPELVDFIFTNQDVGSDDENDSDVDFDGWAYFTLLDDENKDDLDAGLFSL